MKTISRLTIIAALAAVLSFTPGCTTTSTGQKVPDVATMCVVAKSAAYTGGTLYMQKNPASRTYFVQARDALNVLLAAGTFNTEQLKAALQALPIKELKGDQGSLIVGEALILWDAYGKQLANLDQSNAFATYILPVAINTRDGIDLALQMTAP